MKTILLACAESTLLDANSNRVSLINIHDALSSPQFPFLIPSFSVLAVTRKEDGEGDELTCSIRISLGDQTVLDTPVLVNYDGSDIHRSIIGLHGIVITVPGILRIQLLFNDSEIGGCEIPVNQLEPTVMVNGQEA